MTVAVVRSDQIVHDSTNKKNKMASSFGLIVGVVDVATTPIVLSAASDGMENSPNNVTVQINGKATQTENQLDSDSILKRQMISHIKNNISVLEDEIPQLKLSNATQEKVMLLQSKIKELKKLRKNLDAVEKALESLTNIQTQNWSVSETNLIGQTISHIKNNISLLNEEIGPLRLILLKLQSSRPQTKDLEAEQKELISKLENEINQKDSQRKQLQKSLDAIQEARESLTKIQTENRSDGQTILQRENIISVLEKEIGLWGRILLNLKLSPAQTEDLKAEQNRLISKLENEINQKKSQLEELKENCGANSPSEPTTINGLTQEDIEETNQNGSDDQESESNQSESQLDSGANSVSTQDGSQFDTVLKMIGEIPKLWKPLFARAEPLIKKHGFTTMQAEVVKYAESMKPDEALKIKIVVAFSVLQEREPDEVKQLSIDVFERILGICHGSISYVQSDIVGHIARQEGISGEYTEVLKHDNQQFKEFLKSVESTVTYYVEINVLDEETKEKISTLLTEISESYKSILEVRVKIAHHANQIGKLMKQYYGLKEPSQTDGSQTDGSLSELEQRISKHYDKIKELGVTPYNKKNIVKMSEEIVRLLSVLDKSIPQQQKNSTKPIDIFTWYQYTESSEKVKVVVPLEQMRAELHALWCVKKTAEQLSETLGVVNSFTTHFLHL